VAGDATGPPGLPGAAGLVVVTLDCGACGVDDVLAATQWAADHAEELGADPARLLVGGTGAGAAVAAEVVARARRDGWPPVGLAGPAGEPQGYAS
jgi:hypothetical protein